MKKVLTIDGGGMKGLIPAIVCRELERRGGRPLGEVFDLMVGTSTGAVIAAAVGVGIEAERIVELYVQEGPRIFSRPRWYPVRLLGAKYPGSRLQDALRTYLGDRPLGAVRPAVMTTAYDVTGTWDAAGNPGPVFFKSWREVLHDVPLADAVHASAAAPSYFPPHRVAVPWKPGVTACLYDGGIYAGDPAMCAYAEARSLWSGEDVLVASIGTGRREAPTRCSEAVGLLRLAQRLHGWMLDGSSDTVPYVADRVLAHYVRLDAPTRRHVAMDDASPEALHILKSAADELIAMHDEALNRILA